ncbi:MAG: molybdopterin cofactor-binding domain-containing protein, partial [Pseudomonadota bacterium]
MNIRTDPAKLKADPLAIERKVVGHGHPHDSARRHVRGEAIYIDDMPELPGTLHLAPVLSSVAKGKLNGIDSSAAAALPGVVRVITARDIPGKNEAAPILANEPFLAEDEVLHVGQIVAVVAAETFDLAQQAARLVKLDIEEETPNFDLDTAFEADEFTHPTQHLKSGDVDARMSEAEDVLSGSLTIGGQDHFYLETNIALAIPGEDDDMLVWSSTQHPTEVQIHTALALGIASHCVDVQVRRMGGGFGGKESQPTIIAGIAAVMARLTRKPCRFRLRRHDDMAATGKRHGFTMRYDVGLDETGRFKGLAIEALANSGHVADLSGPVVTRAMTHFDNCYHLPATDFTGFA